MLPSHHDPGPPLVVVGRRRYSRQYPSSSLRDPPNHIGLYLRFRILLCKESALEPLGHPRPRKIRVSVPWALHPLPIIDPNKLCGTPSGRQRRAMVARVCGQAIVRLQKSIGCQEYHYTGRELFDRPRTEYPGYSPAFIKRNLEVSCILFFSESWYTTQQILVTCRSNGSLADFG